MYKRQVSLVHTGGDLTGWVNPTTEADAYGLSCADHISSSQICIDMSSSSSIVNMTFDADLQSYYASPYSWLRVFANGTQLTDVNGAGVWNNTTVTGGANTYTFDLSAYAGQSQVYIKFETSCKYGPNYSTGAFGNYVVLDNINVFNVTPCTYYGIAEDYSFDASCNGGADGSASATVVNSNGSDVYSWTDAAGTVVSTATSVSGLSAGTYTCTVSDTVKRTLPDWPSGPAPIHIIGSHPPPSCRSSSATGHPRLTMLPGRSSVRPNESMLLPVLAFAVNGS